MLVTVAIYSAVWLGIHFGVGYLAHRLPAARLVGMPAVSVVYPWERSGRVYEALGIRIWKDRLPEAGDFYDGGFSKRSLECRDLAYLERFVAETARAELSHWVTWAMALTFFAWCPWEVGVAMLVYGAVVNLPCILIQRYNRARLQRAVSVLARRADRNGAILPANAVAH